MLRKIRTILAIIALTLITLLFLDVTGIAHAWLGWLAKIQFLPAVMALNVVVVAALVVLTLIFGRIYCSVICPLGILQDVISWIHGRKKKNRFSYSKEKKWLRYAALAVLIVALVAGVTSLSSLLAPYSSYGRIASNLFQPVYLWTNNGLAALAAHFNSYAFYSVDVWMRSLPTFIIATVTLVVLIILAWRGGRTYCNTICPVGTVLSFFARFSFLKIHFDTTKCRNCSACSRNCKAACIDFKNHTVDYSRCVVCGDCLTKCRFDALHYCHPHSDKQAATVAQPATQPTATDKGRRSFLVAAAVATTTAALAQEKKKLDGGLAAIVDKKAPKRQTTLTPPGSVSARHFYQHCTACQLCVAECPNQVLRPSTDLLHLMQPTMSYERGYCRPECTRCSQVCPAGAIHPIQPDAKSGIHIGHAVWVKDNCVAVTDGVDCGNCERHCPVGAIQMVPYEVKPGVTAFVPAVDESVCIGCGACENLCPARPFSAIYVEGHEMHQTK